jgi:hypothetical protein
MGVPTLRSSASRNSPRTDLMSGDVDELHAVYPGPSGLLLVQIRVFLEFLAARINIDEARPTRNA